MQKTWTYREIELREEIASEIEKWASDFEDKSVQQTIVILCANIARKHK